MNEAAYMHAVRLAWVERCKSTALKPGTKRRAEAMECYLQGVLAAATAIGAMTMERAGQIGFLVAVGRGEEYLAIKEVANAPA